MITRGSTILRMPMQCDWLGDNCLINSYFYITYSMCSYPVYTSREGVLMLPDGH